MFQFMFDFDSDHFATNLFNFFVAFLSFVQVLIEKANVSSLI
jgi:hypothetical protein